jgi:mitochondrial Rho GTPase 1
MQCFHLCPLYSKLSIHLQVKCFNAPLELPQIADVKTVVQQDVPEGINSHGLTFPGFLYIHNMFLRKGNPETFWAVLRYFGYDNDLKLKDDFLPVPSKTAPDQVILTYSIIM